MHVRVCVCVRVHLLREAKLLVMTRLCDLMSEALISVSVHVCVFLYVCVHVHHFVVSKHTFFVCM